MNRQKLLALFISVFVLIACGAVSAQQGGKIVVGVTYEAPVLDQLTSGTAHASLWQIFDTLVTKDLSGEIQPGLAESWDVSDDGLEWTFYLRRGVLFHDGNPLDAHAVKWFFDMCRDPNGKHAFSSSYSPIDEIVAKDEYTVVFKLKTTWPFFLDTLVSSFAGIISPEAYKELGSDYGVIDVVGSGAFMFKEWVPGERMVIARNPDYNWPPAWLGHDGPAYLDEIEYRYYPEEATRIAELETGGIDILYGVSAQHLDRLRATGQFEFFERPMWGGCLLFLGFNLEKEPFDDPIIRQAISHAVDRERILEFVFDGRGDLAYGYVAPSIFGHLPNPEDYGYHFDPDLALVLLEEADWTRGDDEWLYKDGQRFTTNIYTRNDDFYRLSAEIVQENLRNIGIQVEINLGDFASYVEYCSAGVHDMNLAIYGWSKVDILNFWFPSSQIPYPNAMRVRDDFVDTMLEQATGAPTIEDSIEIYNQVEAYLIEKAVWVPIMFRYDIVAVNKRIAGYYAHPTTATYYMQLHVK